MSVELIFTVAIMGFIGYKIAGFLIDTIKSRQLNSSNSGEVDKEILEGMRVEKEVAASEEMRSVLGVIDEMEDEEGAEGFRLIKQLVVDMVVADPDKTISSLKDDGLSARTLTLLLTLNILGEELTSGKHHTYRGVLSANGDRLLRLWDFAVKQQKQSGYYDEEEAQNDLKWIREGIKTVG
jgi:hypothetical protein